MTNYDVQLSGQVIFPEVELVNVLAEVVSKAGLKQFHSAETEKYAHVTYFFNGGREDTLQGRRAPPGSLAQSGHLRFAAGNERLSADRGHAEAHCQTHDDDFILVNFANPDMVGHTGVLEAAIKAVETVDECVGRLVEADRSQGRRGLRHRRPRQLRPHDRPSPASRTLPHCPAGGLLRHRLRWLY
jgi:2,3-bisphosphoglycerate-independent phosphoglycerate mutase